VGDERKLHGPHESGRRRRIEKEKKRKEKLEEVKKK
jgi:hypothetical protein